MKLDYINEENKFNEDEFEELTEDEIYLNKGADAYQAGDYETAIRLYQKSADMGNITALSNLGYCYYYGRSFPVDKRMLGKGGYFRRYSVCLQAW